MYEYSILMIGIGIGGVLTIATQILGSYLENNLKKKQELHRQNEARKGIKIDIK